MDARRETQLRSLLDSSRNGKFEEKRTRLANQVQQRLIGAYDPSGSRHLKSIIEAEVQALLRKRNNSKILERDLTELENKIRDKAGEAAVRSVIGMPNPNSKSSTPLSNQHGRGDEALPNGGGQGGKSLNDREEATSYHLFMEADLEQLKQEKLAKQRAWRKSQQHEKSVLDGQMEELRQRKALVQAEEATRGVAMKESIKEYENSDQLARQGQVKKFNMEKEKRIAQQRQFKAKKQALLDRKHREDQTRIDQCVRELDDERQLGICERLEQQSYAARVQQANEEQRAHRALVRKKECEEDLQRAEEYSQKLMREEQQRKDAITTMQAKSNKNQQMYLQATQEKRDQESADMKRALEAQVQREVNENAKAAQRAAKIKQNRVDMNRALSDQVRTIERRKEAEEELAESWAEDARKQAKEAAKQADAEMRARRQDIMDNRKAIERQMYEKKVRGELPMRMDGREQKMNSVEVNEILRSDVIAERVKSRISRELIVGNSNARAKGWGSMNVRGISSKAGTSSGDVRDGGGSDKQRRRNYYGQ